MLCMYYVCIICMYYMYVLNVCIVCMYYMCYMYVKLRGQVALRGQKVHGKRKLRIQGRMQIFEKKSQMALNHDLRPELESRGKMLQIPLKNHGFRCFLRRAVIILLQKKNFGPNVIYYVLILLLYYYY